MQKKQIVLIIPEHFNSWIDQQQCKPLRTSLLPLDVLRPHLLAIKTDFPCWRRNRGTMSAARLLIDGFCEFRDTEQIIHLLQRQALGLRDEEPDEEEHAETEGAVDEEGTESSSAVV